MQFVVLAYPLLSKSDYEFVQTIRKLHDKQFAILEPHFTVVFPTEKLSQLEMLEHIKNLNLNIKPFTFTLTKAVVEENTFQKYFQVHLVADNLIPEIVELHDAMYVGMLESELRSGIPYMPHITIAGDGDKSVMQKLANDINAKGFVMNGSVEGIVLSSFDGKKVIDLKRYELK